MMYCKGAPEYWLLSGGLLGAYGYLGGEDFMGWENLLAYCTRKLMSDILLRDYDSVCSDISCTIGNWWSGELNLLWRLRILCRFCVEDTTDISNWELNVTCGHWFLNSCGNVKA
jgi:hypothetical protein